MVIPDHDPTFQPVVAVLRVLEQQRDERLDLQDLEQGSVKIKIYLLKIFLRF